MCPPCHVFALNYDQSSRTFILLSFQRSCDDTRRLNAECQNTKQCQLLDSQSTIRNLASTICLRVAELQLPLHFFHYTFYPEKLSCFAGKKMKFVGITKISLGGPLQNGSNASLTTKVSKVKHFLEGSGHPNFTNPFEYALQGKSFPKRIGTLPTQPKDRGGGGGGQKVLPYIPDTLK